MKRAVPPEKSNGRLSICKILADWQKIIVICISFSSPSCYPSVKRVTNTTVCMYDSSINFLIYCLFPPSRREASRKKEGKEGRKGTTMNGDVYVRDAAKQRCSCPRCASRVLSVSSPFSFSLSHVLSSPLLFSSPLCTLSNSALPMQRKYRTNSDSIIVILEMKQPECVSVSDTVFRDDSIISQLKLQHIRGTQPNHSQCQN